MKLFSGEQEIRQNMTFKVMSIPAKALSTCIILTLSFGMIGALGQVVIHDIIPTFQTSAASVEMSMSPTEHKKKRSVTSESIAAPQRGDLFSELSQPVSKTKKPPFYKAEQFVWTLKWTHIHLFGMGMIFIFMGVISLLLDASPKLRTWLIVLPFLGVLIDISAMWLKAFVSPAFFWLHIPGGGVFAVIFAYVSLRALWEMWATSQRQK
ncbi:MAG: hypothetical protein DRH90_04340 [Deltaproteobacteria bacterium]|nr:MAG: hypothetical protein DRH90_04340 [Deltaproteobacteria bacterium]RLC10779.1 MAG: hypothetical protein DRI24_19760 [Deltaproteobacteria bacterium]